jgi:hypothetical protein
MTTYVIQFKDKDSWTWRNFTDEEFVDVVFTTKNGAAIVAKFLASIPSSFPVWRSEKWRLLDSNGVAWSQTKEPEPEQKPEPLHPCHWSIL